MRLLTLSLSPDKCQPRTLSTSGYAALLFPTPHFIPGEMPLEINSLLSDSPTHRQTLTRLDVFFNDRHSLTHGASPLPFR